MESSSVCPLPSVKFEATYRYIRFVVVVLFACSFQFFNLCVGVLGAFSPHILFINIIRYEVVTELHCRSACAIC